MTLLSALNARTGTAVGIVENKQVDVVSEKVGGVYGNTGSPGMSLSNPFPLPSLSERVKEHVQDGTDTLYIYPNACADALKEWFRSEIDAWMDTPLAHRQGNAPIAALIISLIQDTYSLVCWKHVAEAFRTDY